MAEESLEKYRNALDMIRHHTEMTKFYTEVANEALNETTLPTALVKVEPELEGQSSQNQPDEQGNHNDELPVSDEFPHPPPPPVVRRTRAPRRPRARRHNRSRSPIISNVQRPRRRSSLMQMLSNIFNHNGL